MNKKQKFLKDFHDLLEKYNVTIDIRGFDNSFLIHFEQTDYSSIVCSGYMNSEVVKEQMPVWVENKETT